MDGAEGPRCQSVRQFADNLLEKIDIPIACWDERLSTAAVERVLIKEADMTRKRRKWGRGRKGWKSTGGQPTHRVERALQDVGGGHLVDAIGRPESGR